MKTERSCAILCVDIGTSSLKAALIDECGFLQDSTRVHFSTLSKNIQNTVISNNSNNSNQNFWLQAFFQACKNLDTKNNKQLKAISISGNGPTLVSLTDKTEFTLLWNTPSKINISCNYPSIYLPKILQLKQDFPNIWNNTKTILSGPEYLIYKLTNTQCTILAEKRFLPAYWTNEMLTEYEISSDLFPDFVPLGYNAGNVIPEIQSIISSNKTIPVFCGGPDFITALIGTNTLSQGKICDRCGSSEGINLCTPKPINDTSIRNLPSVISNLHNASILLPDTGIVFSNWKKTSIWKDKSYLECIQELKNYPNDDGYKLMINIATKVKKAFETLISYVKSTTSSYPIYCTGGQAKNPEWMQIKSNITQLPLSITTCPDSELMGNAIIATTSLGIYSNITESANNLVKTKKTYFPQN